MNASGHLTPKDSLKALETLSKDLPDQKVVWKNRQSVRNSI